MTQDKNGDDGGRTLMFNPSESEEFRKAMEKERALQEPQVDSQEDDASPKTMMFSPGQVTDALKKQAANLAQENEPSTEDEIQSAKTMMFSPGQVSEALEKQAANLAREKEPATEEEIQSSKTMAFSASDVAEHVKRLQQHAAGDSGNTDEEPGTSTSPNLPAGGSSTLSYSKDEVDRLREELEKKKSDGGEDLGTAQTMMYSVEDSQLLKEAMAMLEQNKGADAQARDEAQDLLREARKNVEAKDNFQPTNPFAVPPPEAEDAGGPDASKSTPVTQPSSPKAPAGPSRPSARPPRPGGPRPGRPGPPPGRPAAPAAPKGPPTVGPSLPYGSPSTTTSSLTEQALSGAAKKGGALKVFKVLVGVAVAGAVVAGLLHVFGVFDLPFDFLPRF